MPTDDKPHPPGRAIWFPAKRYGWGWGPPFKWQGWMVLGVWAVLLVWLGTIVMLRSWVGYVAFVFVMFAILMAIFFAKGERPRWR